ncbi:MAG: aminotransferase class I/II-fold pyridoxal phosphate-dependent enzyme [Verrucomicrobia bacterium]|nr:aminotransferase class I/II-fold pyridoxal phosphate-dependent enzyme [Verrucomicrobiota bacterium]
MPRSGIREFFELVQGADDVISLGIGEPDFVTPWHIREAAIYALEKGKTGYTSNLGLLKLRKSVSKYMRKEFEVEYDPTKEILIAVGVSEALDIALRATINPGDKVMYHEPCYVSYHPTILMTHGVGVKVPTSEEDKFALNPKRLWEYWEPGVKVLVLNFPTNPTGGTMTREQLLEIARFAQEKDVLVLSDEIYAELTFEGKHTSIASLPGMRDRTILLHGCSKAFAMTGFRIGFACANPELTEAMMKVHQYSMLCAPILSQEAAFEALENGADSVARMKEQYQRRRDLIVRKLNASGLACHLSNGTFYAFPSIKSTGLDSKSFSLRLFEEQRVAAVPGTAFGESGEGFIRCSYSTSYENLLQATDLIDKFVQSL